MNNQEIELIEQAPLSLIERTELLLIYAKQKPATHIEIEASPKSPYNPQTNTFKLTLQEINRIKELLQHINLPFKIGKSKKFIPYIHINETNGDIKQPPFKEKILFCIGKNENFRDKLFNAILNNDDEKQGHCYGFPETAIQAYLNRIERLDKEKESFNNQILGEFALFIMSKVFFHQELETSQRWHDTVRKLSPNLYAEIEQNRQNTTDQIIELCCKNHDLYS